MTRLLPVRIRSCVAELRRRKVFPVALAYLVVAWALAKVADLIVPALHLPDWVVTLVVVLVGLGFPIALLLAWALDLTPDGMLLPEQPPGGATDRIEGADPAAPRDPVVPGRPVATPGIPPQYTPLVGREEELRQLQELLRDPASRLITIVGAGGVGKTRLALEVARAGAPGLDGSVVFVPLGESEPADSLAPTLANHLGLTPPRQQDPEQPLLDYLREKRLLLIIDNFEHVVSAATLLGNILDTAPGIRLLVTSRERLGLQSELLFPLQGLRVPDESATEESTERFGSVLLFLQGARRVDGTFTPAPHEQAAIARICRLLSGIPLAIELASAWVRAFSCEQILAEIERDLDFLVSSYRDVPPRHRSLRAAFDSSWRLLPGDERSAFLRLSVFRGGFSREAAMRVASVPLPVLSSLLDKSLLRRVGRDRFEIIEVLRQYVAAKQAEAPAEERWMRADPRERGRGVASAGAAPRPRGRRGDCRFEASGMRPAREEAGHRPHGGFRAGSGRGGGRGGAAKGEGALARGCHAGSSRDRADTRQHVRRRIGTHP